MKPATDGDFEGASYETAAMTETSVRLFHAVAADDVPALRQWIRAGDDLEARDAQGATALLVAAERGSPAMVRALLSGGADVRAEDANGNTALHLAARRGDEEMIDDLFGAGALVDAQNRAGLTPLRAALGAGQEKAAAALVDRGAEATQGDAE
jgi:ankyrin repeat protein